MTYPANREEVTIAIMLKHEEANKHETAVCRTTYTVVWEVGKYESGDKHLR